MRRLEASALFLAFFLALSACGGEGEPAAGPPDPPLDDSDTVLYQANGLDIALPAEYQDLLRVDTSFPDAAESWKPLISVYEKASYEAAMEEYGGGGGFLFGLLVMDQAAFEQHISADGSGIDVFATDGERYYAYTYPTDVQFCRPGGDVGTQSEDWKTWEELCEIGPQVREDFLERNGLQSFSVQDFLSQGTDGGAGVYVRYYPYFVPDGDTRIYDQLLLRQPARQGEGGIWAVSSWTDEFGNDYFYFPDSGLPAAEYYAGLQEECDAGAHPELLTPLGAADAFVKDYFGHETAEGSFETGQDFNGLYVETNRRLEEILLDLLVTPEEVDETELLSRVGEARADNWGVLGRYLYGSDWFGPLMDAVAGASIGEDQQWRDKMVLSFYLAAEGLQTDFHAPLSGILRSQKNMDPDAYQAALEEFSGEEQEILLGAHFGFASAPLLSDIPELAEALPE